MPLVTSGFEIHTKPARVGGGGGGQRLVGLFKAFDFNYSVLMIFNF